MISKKEFDHILHRLLRNSTNLTDLNICLNHPSEDSEDFFITMFELYQWPKLEKFTPDVYSSRGLSCFHSFYQRHPTLTTLFLGVPLVPGFFPNESETRVTSLYIPCMSGLARDILPDYIAQNLVHLSLDQVSENTFEGIKFPSLRSCVLPRIIWHCKTHPGRS